MQAMPIQPAIQPPTPREADTRPDQPPFAGTLEDASRSFSPKREDGIRRETGAIDSADPAPSLNTEVSDQALDVEVSTSSKGDPAHEPIRDEELASAASEVEPGSDSDDASEHSGAVVNDANPSPRPTDSVLLAAPDVRIGVDTGSMEIDGGRNAPTSGEDGPMRSRGTVGPEVGRMTTSGAGTAADFESSGSRPDASATARQGMVAATGTVRPTSDQRSATSTIDGTGSKAIPEGLRRLDPAAMATVDPRSRESATGDSNSGQRGATAVARAAEMNTALRNARGDAGASNGQGSAIFTAAGSISAALGASGPASAGPEAQSLPTGPASVAPMDAGADSGRTVGGVARGLQALTAQRGGTLVMRLDPGNLGQVRMEMSLDAGRVQVVIAAAGDAARGLLRENLGVLRHALEDRGFAVERLTVESTTRTTADSSGPRGDSRGDGQDARGGQGSSDRQDASDERSRGRRDDATNRRSERGRSDSDRFQEVLAGSGATSNA